MYKPAGNTGVTNQDPELTAELRTYLDRIHNSANVDYDYVLQIVDDGADVNTYDSRLHWSLLMLSLYEETPDQLKALLKRNADTNATDCDGRTALHHAAMSGMKGAPELLIAHGAHINTLDDNGWTPLHFAINHRQLGMVKALLAKGANPYARTSLGDTPLLLAEDVEFPEASALLHQHFSLRHSNRVRALRCHNHKKRGLKP